MKIILFLLSLMGLSTVNAASLGYFFKAKNLTFQFNDSEERPPDQIMEVYWRYQIDCPKESYSTGPCAYESSGRVAMKDGVIALDKKTLLFNEYSPRNPTITFRIRDVTCIGQDKYPEMCEIVLPLKEFNRHNEDFPIEVPRVRPQVRD